MCNLYSTKKSAAEIASLFRAEKGPIGNAAAGEVFPGYPGMVVAEGVLRSMAWGFPLSLKGKSGQALKPRPVNNARTDKLGSFMWRYSFEERRCLIPASAWSEAEGERGAMTRTWFSLPDQDVFACAGIWRDSPEWGPVYSMVMTEACVHVGPVHDRMPVNLRPEDWPTWTDAAPADALALCRPYDGAMNMLRTAETWSKRS